MKRRAVLLGWSVALIVACSANDGHNQSPVSVPPATPMATSIPAVAPPPPPLPPTVTPPPSSTVSNNLSGGYMADNRPRWMSYLTLTQVGGNLSGYILVAAPDGQGGTASRQFNVQGQGENGAVTITAGGFLTAGGVTLVGRFEREELALTSPSASGRVETLTYRRASQDVFNQTLEVWQRTLAEERQRAYAAAATAQAEQEARTKAQEQAIGPSCWVGLDGHAVALEIRGKDAPAHCKAIVAADSDRYTREPSRDPIVCQYSIEGYRYIVRDIGLRIYGDGWCGRLLSGGLAGPPSLGVRAVEVQAIATAVNGYLRDQGSRLTGQVVVGFTGIDGDYATASVRAKDGSAQPAGIYLQRERGAWRVLGLGTMFDDDRLRAWGIPRSLWP